MERPHSRLELTREKLDRFYMDGPGAALTLTSLGVLAVVRIVLEETGSDHPALLVPLYLVAILIVADTVLRIAVEYVKPTRRPIDWRRDTTWWLIVFGVLAAVVIGAGGVWAPDADDDRTSSLVLFVGGLVGAGLVLRHLSKPIAVRPRRRGRRRRRRTDA